MVLRITFDRFGMADAQIPAGRCDLIKAVDELICRHGVKIDHHVSAENDVKGFFRHHLLHKVKDAKDHFFSNLIAHLIKVIRKLYKIFLFPYSGQPIQAFRGIDPLPCF